MPFKTRDFYKVVRQDGTDIFSGTLDWVALIGTTYEHPEPEIVTYGRNRQRVDARTAHAQGTWGLMCTNALVHASHKPWYALRSTGSYTLFYLRLEPLYLRMLLLHGTPVASDGRLYNGHAHKHGFKTVDVVRELTHDEIAGALFMTTDTQMVYGDWRNKVQISREHAVRLARPFDKKRRKPLTIHELQRW